MKSNLLVFVLAFIAITLPAFAGGPTYHSADTDFDNQISLSELLRVIQFYNVGTYHSCPDAGTEDGFCTGPQNEGEGETITYDLLVNVAGDGWIEMSPVSPSYPACSTVTVTAYPSANHHFVGWVGDSDSKGLYQNNPREITMNRNKAITAIFEQDCGGEGEGQAEGEGAIEGEGSPEGALEGEGQAEGEDETGIDLLVDVCYIMDPTFNDPDLSDFFAHIVTVGGVVPQAFQVQWIIDGVPYHTDTIEPTSQDWLYGLDWPEVTPGGHIVYLVIDSANQITETNEHNNTSVDLIFTFPIENEGEVASEERIFNFVGTTTSSLQAELDTGDNIVVNQDDQKIAMPSTTTGMTVSLLETEPGKQLRMAYLANTEPNYYANTVKGLVECLDYPRYFDRWWQDANIVSLFSTARAETPAVKTVDWLVASTSGTNNASYYPDKPLIPSGISFGGVATYQANSDGEIWESTAGTVYRPVTGFVSAVSIGDEFQYTMETLPDGIIYSGQRCSNHLLPLAAQCQLEVGAPPVLKAKFNSNVARYTGLARLTENGNFTAKFGGEKIYYAGNIGELVPFEVLFVLIDDIWTADIFDRTFDYYVISSFDFAAAQPGTPPEITQQPEPASAVEGDIVGFSFQATGLPPFYRQTFRVKGAEVQQLGTEAGPYYDVPFEGGLTTVATMADNGWSYYFVIRNAYGSVETDHVLLTVLSGDDTTPPVLTLIQGCGDANAVYLHSGTSFVEPGWTATDDRDGNLTDEVTYTISRYVDREPQVVDSIDTSSGGEWIINYQVADAAGNTATASRHVLVFEDMARTTNVVIVDKPGGGLEALIKVQELGLPFPGMDPAGLTQVGLRYYFTDAAPWSDQDLHPFDGVVVAVDLTKFRPPTLRFEIIGFGLPVDDEHPEGIYFGDIWQLNVTYRGLEIPRVANDVGELAYEISFLLQ